MKSVSTIPILFLIGLLTGSCDIYNDPGFEQRYVIESYLVADQPLPEVRLSHTIPADRPYSFSQTAVGGADLSVSLLDDNGSIEERIAYVEVNTGVYRPSDEHIVQPRKTYRLQVEIDGENTITAQTTVPNSYRLTGSIPDSVVYQSPDQLKVTLQPDPPDTLSRQKQFVFNLIAVNYVTATPTPFYADQIENDEVERADFRNNSSGLVSEGNFTMHPDGSIEIRVPWIGFAFYGDNKIVTNSIDQNLYDFSRSQNIQTGGSTLSPGEIPNIKYHIDGGIGIFGSITADTVSTHLLKP